MTAFVTLDTTVLDAQLEGLIEAINTLVGAVQELQGRVAVLEGVEPVEQPVPLTDEDSNPLTDEDGAPLADGTD